MATAPTHSAAKPYRFRRLKIDPTHLDLAKLYVKSAVGLIGATVATNDIPQIYASLDPHLAFWSRILGLVLCVLSIWAVSLTIRKRRFGSLTNGLRSSQA